MLDDAYPKVYLYRRIVQAKRFIDNHYADSIDLDNIADEACFSKFHFFRLFKKAYAKTPHHYLTSVRIEHAKQLLKTNLPVSDVCYAVGFDSLSSFTGLFKRLIGRTPSAYQLQQQKLKDDIATTPLKFIPDCFAEAKGWKKQF
jgi:AraC-like DNA-binding protein